MPILKRRSLDYALPITTQVVGREEVTARKLATMHDFLDNLDHVYYYFGHGEDVCTVSVVRTTDSVPKFEAQWHLQELQVPDKCLYLTAAQCGDVTWNSPAYTQGLVMSLTKTPLKAVAYKQKMDIDGPSFFHHHYPKAFRNAQISGERRKFSLHLPGDSYVDNNFSSINSHFGRKEQIITGFMHMGGMYSLSTLKALLENPREGYDPATQPSCFLFKYDGRTVADVLTDMYGLAHWPDINEIFVWANKYCKLIKDNNIVDLLAAMPNGLNSIVRYENLDDGWYKMFEYIQYGLVNGVGIKRRQEGHEPMFFPAPEAARGHPENVLRHNLSDLMKKFHGIHVYDLCRHIGQYSECYKMRLERRKKSEQYHYEPVQSPTKRSKTPVKTPSAPKGA